MVHPRPPWWQSRTERMKCGRSNVRRNGCCTDLNKEKKNKSNSSTSNNNNHSNDNNDNHDNDNDENNEIRIHPPFLGVLLAPQVPVQS